MFTGFLFVRQFCQGLSECFLYVEWLTFCTNYGRGRVFVSREKVRRMTEAELSELKNEVREALFTTTKPVVIVTGAGMSAESGVPTFRGPGVTWEGHEAQALANADAFERDPRLVWGWYMHRRRIVAQARPHAGHEALASWMNKKSSAFLITQNVDDLHERTGVRALHVHGSLWRNRCSACGREREDHSLELMKDLPCSPCCRAIERPAIVWFGESLGAEIHAQIAEAFWTAKFVLVIGTSGIVAPMNEIIQSAYTNLGKPIIDLNLEGSAFQDAISVRGGAKDLLPWLLGEVALKNPKEFFPWGFRLGVFEFGFSSFPVFSVWVIWVQYEE